MNAHDRRKHDRLLVALLTRGPHRGAVRRLKTKQAWVLRGKCYQNAYHTVPTTEGVDLDLLKVQEKFGNLTDHVIGIQPEFARRYPRATKALPAFYRRTYKGVTKTRNYGLLYAASPETISQAVLGEPLSGPLLQEKLDDFDEKARTLTGRFRDLRAHAKMGRFDAAQMDSRVIRAPEDRPAPVFVEMNYAAEEIRIAAQWADRPTDALTNYDVDKVLRSLTGKDRP